MPTWTVIFNPSGGGHRAGRLRNKLVDCLRQTDISFRLHSTTATGDAEHFAVQAYAQGSRHFAIAGGDGTANEVINGLYSAAGERAPSDLTLGILPLGSGNDWARSLGIPRRLNAACQLLRTGRVQRHDLGLIQLYRNGQAYQRCFLNIAGTGIDSYLVPLIHGRSGGRWRYYIALLRGLRKFSAPSLAITADKFQFSGHSLVAFISIGRYLGGGLLVTPDARPDDGLLDITVIDDISLPRVMVNLPRLFTGHLAQSRWVHVTQSSRAVLDCLSDIEADGELLGQGPAGFQIHRHWFQVMVAAT